MITSSPSSTRVRSDSVTRTATSISASRARSRPVISQSIHTSRSFTGLRLYADVTVDIRGSVGHGGSHGRPAVERKRHPGRAGAVARGLDRRNRPADALDRVRGLPHRGGVRQRARAALRGTRPPSRISRCAGAGWTSRSRRTAPEASRRRISTWPASSTRWRPRSRWPSHPDADQGLLRHWLIPSAMRRSCRDARSRISSSSPRRAACRPRADPGRRRASRSPSARRSSPGRRSSSRSRR